MALVPDFHNITARRQEGDEWVFEVVLNPDCKVYEGHFPGEPVAPGVCNIQMLKECAEEVARKPLMITYIQQCRMTKLITPIDCPSLSIHISLNEDTLLGSIYCGEEVCLTLKATVA